jgi:hypothetical protein
MARFVFQLLFLMMVLMGVLGHPWVSNPKRGRELDTEPDWEVGDEIEDLYALNPEERPLHTTVLMAMATARARARAD